MDSESLVVLIPEPVLHPKDRERYLDSLRLVSRGAFESDLVMAKGFTLAELSLISDMDTTAKKMFTEARRKGNEVRQMIREDAADTRAVKGVTEDIFTVKGDKVGRKQVYSDSLLSLMLKANDPEKYSSTVSGFASGGLVLNVNLGLVRDPVPVKIIDVKDIKEILPNGLPAKTAIADSGH